MNKRNINIISESMRAGTKSTKSANEACYHIQRPMTADDDVVHQYGIDPINVVSVMDPLNGFAMDDYGETLDVFIAGGNDTNAYLLVRSSLSDAQDWDLSSVGYEATNKNIEMLKSEAMAILEGIRDFNGGILDYIAHMSKTHKLFSRSSRSSNESKSATEAATRMGPPDQNDRYSWDFSDKILMKVTSLEEVDPMIGRVTTPNGHEVDVLITGTDVGEEPMSNYNYNSGMIYVSI